MKPISFMRLRKAIDLTELENKYGPKNLSVEEKFDGFKLMATAGRAGAIKLYTRRGQDVTRRLEDLSSGLSKLLEPGDVVLGEIVYQIGDEQSLQSIQSIVGSRDPKRSTERARSLGGDIVFYVYDMLADKRSLISGMPLSFRRKSLNKRFSTQGKIRRVKVYPWDKRSQAIKNSLKNGGEGIVIKPNDSHYLWRPKGQNEPWGDWYKFKAGLKHKTDDVILTSYTKGKEKLIFRAEQCNAKGRRVFVGNLSGLDKASERSISDRINAGHEVLVEVSYQQRYPTGKMRHMGWVRERPDKPISSATVSLDKETQQIRKHLR